MHEDVRAGRVPHVTYVNSGFSVNGFSAAATSSLLSNCNPGVTAFAAICEAIVRNGVTDPEIPLLSRIVTTIRIADVSTTTMPTPNPRRMLTTDVFFFVCISSPRISRIRLFYFNAVSTSWMMPATSPLSATSFADPIASATAAGEEIAFALAGVPEKPASNTRMTRSFAAVGPARSPR
jgi:hypothetical protein